MFLPPFDTFIAKSLRLIAAVAATGAFHSTVLAETPTEAAVGRAVATSSDAVFVNGKKNGMAIYVGKFSNGCESVAVLWEGGHQQNYQVCGGIATDRRTVAPAWASTDQSKRLLQAVVSQALSAGRAEAIDPDGYRIVAERAAYGGNCAQLNVKVTYDGELSDLAAVHPCGVGGAKRR